MGAGELDEDEAQAPTPLDDDSGNGRNQNVHRVKVCMRDGVTGGGEHETTINGPIKIQHMRHPFFNGSYFLRACLGLAYFLGPTRERGRHAARFLRVLIVIVHGPRCARFPDQRSAATVVPR